MKLVISTLLFFSSLVQSFGQVLIEDSVRNVYGFAIAAPQPQDMERFVQFIDQELGPNGINTLVLRVDYGYEYESYPNLRNENPLSKKEVKKIVAAAQKWNIQLIPQINLLGHQSWAGDLEMLLTEYPEFDETPHVSMPREYKWPNEDGLYCKSYCPLHPKVHEVVFALVDEVTEVFESKAFHAGMDEVFYIGDDKCPRCAGKNNAQLFADEVGRIRDHLAQSGRELWIWGDRMLEGEISGLGMWEASENGTEASIDLVPKDIVVCDWHYNVAEPTPAIFASRGLQVVSCFWNKEEVALAHMEMMDFFKANSNETMRPKYLGTMQTIWSPAKPFLDAYYEVEGSSQSSLDQAASFKAMLKYIKEQE
ncbi:family 20 glycosylhydrolase [Reichenbachiella ulvae]|uniref:Family 20 glycosylhydrolase n=1 Tax=Reichenbachiella ulvae TaxID=2980104 RepID=A0ABT3CS95_9BACT|nr:family 20 glycosylhydrolase [Reichenbachiella ulvae]MCV9386576.1 family 20 glycosylhydrolase [Reichenbachiella ulvae]